MFCKFCSNNIMLLKSYVKILSKKVKFSILILPLSSDRSRPCIRRGCKTRVKVATSCKETMDGCSFPAPPPTLASRITTRFKANFSYEKKVML